MKVKKMNNKNFKIDKDLLYKELCKEIENNFKDNGYYASTMEDNVDKEILLTHMKDIAENIPVTINKIKMNKVTCKRLYLYINMFNGKKFGDVYCHINIEIDNSLEYNKGQIIYSDGTKEDINVFKV